MECKAGLTRGRMAVRALARQVRLLDGILRHMSPSSISRAIRTLDAASFGEFVQRGVVLVDFSEPWCGPCDMQLPILERVAERVGQRASVALLNVDAAPALAAHFHIEAIPTLLLLKNGRVARTFVGVHAENTLTDAILAVAGTPAAF